MFRKIKFFLYNLLYKVSEENIKRQIEKHDIISFDIFDTLLIRPYIYPWHLFKHMELTYKVRGFCKNRRMAESQARKNSNNEDITFDEIYDRIPECYKNMKEKELDFEKMVLKRNERVYPLYLIAKNLNKKIVFISDMYLPRNFLEEILKDNGYDKFDDIYISGDRKVCKTTGGLYRLFISDHKLKASKRLHLGDDFRADYISPKKEGLHAIWLRKNSDIFFNEHKCLKDIKKNKDSLTLSIFLSFWVEQNVTTPFLLMKENRYWHDLGFVLGGPLVLGFLVFFVESLKKYDCKQWVFVARDGYWLWKAINILYEHEKNYYIYAQRSIGHLILGYQNCFSNYDVFIEELKKNGITSNTDLCSVKDKRSFVMKNIKNLEKIDSNYVRSYTNYLLSMGIVKNEKIGLIDSGACNFTAQKLLELCLNTETLGIYTHINDKRIATDLSCNYLTWADNRKSLINIISMIEFILMAPEPPVIGIDKKNQPIYQDCVDKKELYRNKIAMDIGAGICDFVKKYKERFGKDGIINFSEIDVNDIFGAYEAHLRRIDKKMLKTVYVPGDSKHSIYKETLKKYIDKQIKYMNICFLGFKILSIKKCVDIYILLFGFIPLLKIKNNWVLLFEILPVFKLKLK